MLFLSHFAVPGLILARRSGRGIGRLLVYLYEGCTTGDPIAITISIVIAAVIVGWIVAKFSRGSS